MKSKGHDVFIDVNSITIGDPWARSIEKNISDCDMFVVILTPDALSDSYVKQEVLQAQKQNKIIVPCIHETVEYDEIKWGLEENQGIEFSDKFELALNLYPKIKAIKIGAVDQGRDGDSLDRSNPKISHVNQIEHTKDTPILEDIDALNKKDVTFNDQGKYQEAIDYHDKALWNDTINVAALIDKGNILYNQLKYQEAIKYYDKALKVDPNSGSAQEHKIQALAQLKKSKKKGFFGFGR